MTRSSQKQTEFTVPRLQKSRAARRPFAFHRKTVAANRENTDEIQPRINGNTIPLSQPRGFGFRSFPRNASADQSA